MPTLTPPFAALVLALVGVAGGQVASAADDYNRQANDLRAKYTGEIEQLATWCDQRAEGASGEDPPGSGTAIRTSSTCRLPREIGHPAAGRRPARRGRVGQQARAAPATYADGLLDLARRAVRAGGPRWPSSWRWRRSKPTRITKACAASSATRSTAATGTPLTKSSSSARRLVWNDKFGWLPQNHAAQYESDKRFYRPSSATREWISADDDARRHDNIESGWDIETEHYRIRTNHSIEAAVALGMKLERLYRVWQEFFVRYYATEAEVVALFDGRPGGSPRPSTRWSTSATATTTTAR